MLASIVLNLTLGIAGAALWVALVWRIGSPSGAGSCVVRIAAAPVLTLIWGAVGIAAVRTPPKSLVVSSYAVVTAITAFFTLYAILFSSWALRVWPDECICAC